VKRTPCVEGAGRRARREGGRTPPRPAGLLLGALALFVTAAAPTAGQDIEVLSELTGIPLPEAYWDRIREDPMAFELPNGLFRNTPLGPLPTGLGRAGPAAAPFRVEGTARLPVILALFADSPEPHIRPEHVRASLFEGPAPSGTLTAFYEELSGGRFRVEGDVFPWVRTSITRAQAVGNSNGLGGTARVGEYLIQALELVDAFVDFSLYDLDGDGVVDAVAFEFLEIAASCGGNSIWPHRSGIANWNKGQPYVTNDVAADGSPIVVNGYIIQGVTDCTGTSVQSAAVIAHEYGHVLGLPDYYHPFGGTAAENRRWVLGCWELMAAGAWGCGPITSERSFGPSHMMAPQKATLGWLDLQEVGEVWDQEFLLGPVQSSGQALLVPLDSTGVEALIIEYRARKGFDHQLPAEGILVTHRDLAASLRPPLGLRYRMRLLEADANDGLVRSHHQGGNRGEAGDAFGVAGAVDRLNAFTRPAVLRNATSQATSVAIHSMTVSGGEARIRLSTSPRPRVMPPAAPVQGTVARPMHARLRIAGGFMPYTVVGVAGLPAGVQATSLEDELLLHGAPLEKGSFTVLLLLGDSRGSGFEVVLPVSVGAFFVTEERLLRPFLRTASEALSPEERTHLDGLGNQNGAFDVGDVRAWLLR